MNFLEKDLEDYICENMRFVSFDGLDCFLGVTCDDPVQTFRQLQLGPYGIADLVHICYASTKNVRVQVIECKRGVLNLAAYAQSKRYLSGVKHILHEAGVCYEWQQLGLRVDWECVLIGGSIEQSRDFLFTISNDCDCSAYTYKLEGKRIDFTRVSKAWQYNEALQHSAVTRFAAQVAGYVPMAVNELEANRLESIQLQIEMEGYGE